MRNRFNLVIVAVTAAATYFVTIEDASAQGRGRSGGSSISRSSGGGSRSVSSTSGNSGNTRSLSSTNTNNIRTLSGNPLRSNQQANGNRQNRGNQASILSPNQRSSLGVGVPRNGINLQANGQRNNLGSNGTARSNLTTNSNATTRSNLTTNVNGNNRPANNLSTNLRTNSSFLRSTTTLPARLTVPANALKLGRIAPPSNLIAKLTLSAPKPGFLATRFKPFLQRHWRTAFFWVAIPTIGYLTIPDHAYDRFVTFVSGSEPDYDGAVKYLSQVAVSEDESHVVRLAPTETVPVRHVVTVAPAPIYDQRFIPFVNRKWNSEFVTISVPRIGNVTCPVSIVEQVKLQLTQNPPKFDEALALIEEAAAADTVVDEGALNDAEIETIQ